MVNNLHLIEEATRGGHRVRKPFSVRAFLEVRGFSTQVFRFTPFLLRLAAKLVDGFGPGFRPRHYLLIPADPESPRPPYAASRSRCPATKSS